MSETKEGQRYWGKYRGTVVNNIDPLQRGRLLLQVHDVFGAAISPWAEPCVPLAGPPGPAMGVYFVPPIGTGVWVEFEQGDPDSPIWVGCRWGSATDVPSPARLGLLTAPTMVLQSLGQHFIAISNLPGPTGGITLKARTGAMIAIDDLGITITNGLGASIVLNGPMVTVNNGALTVI